MRRFFNRLYRYFRPPLYPPEKGSRQRLEALNLKRGDVVIDCGANVGSITGFVAQTKATVHAFEPNPYAYKKLERTFRFYSNVHTYPHAVGDEVTTLSLYYHEFADDNHLKWSVGSSIFAEKTNVNADSSVDVECIDLADFVKSLKKPIRLIKMDIEGAEYRTISHLIRTGAIQQVETLYVETHHEDLEFLQPEYEIMQALIDEHQIDYIHTDWI